MNKFILFISLFIAISSLCASGNATKADDCKNENLTDDEKKNGVDACCFFNYKEKGGSTEYKVCMPYVKKNVLETVKAGRKTYDKYEIDCASNWLSISLYLFALIFMI